VHRSGALETDAPSGVARSCLSLLLPSSPQ